MNERAIELMHRLLDLEITDNEKIELKQILKDPEAMAYFKELKQAEDFMHETALRNFMKECDGEWTLEEIKADIEKYGKNPSPETKAFVEKLNTNYYQRKFRIRTGLQIAAAAMVIGFGMFLWLNFRTSLNERLYVQNYTPHEFIINRSATDVNSKLNAAQQYYNEGNYEASMKRVRYLNDSGNVNDETRFLFALNLQAKEEYGLALAVYNTLTESENEMVKALSAWYGGLCALRLERPEEARNLFQLFRNSGSIYRDGKDVERILNKLD